MSISPFQFSRGIPPELRKAAKHATFMDEGVSSKAWNLNDGRVLKLTNDPRVLALSELLVDEPKSELAKTFLVVRDSVVYEGERYSLVVQKYYPKPNPSTWIPIGQALDKLPGANWWDARTIKESNQRQDKLIHALKTLPQATTIAAKTLMPYARTFALLADFCEHLRDMEPDAGLDIQGIQNWGIDEDHRLVPFDPVA